MLGFEMLPAFSGLLGMSDPAGRLEQVHRALYLEVEVNRRLIHTGLNATPPLANLDVLEFSRTLGTSAMRAYLLQPPETFGERCLLLFRSSAVIARTEDDAAETGGTFHHLILSLHQAIVTTQTLAQAPVALQHTLMPRVRLTNIEDNLAKAHIALRNHLGYSKGEKK